MNMMSFVTTPFSCDDDEVRFFTFSENSVWVMIAFAPEDLACFAISGGVKNGFAMVEVAPMYDVLRKDITN